LHERRFDTGTVEVNYGEGPPNGPPFVILHGGAGSWRSGEALIRLLGHSWHVYAPDFRGHGKSGRVAGHYLLDDYATDTASFLGDVVQDPAVLFGHSLGGEVAIMVAARHPGLVRAAIVGDAPLSPDNHPTEDVTHRQMNVLWHSLSGRPPTEVMAALKEMPVPAPGGTPARAVEVFGEHSPWFEFQAQNLSRLDPGVLAAVLEGPHFMLRGYEPEELLPAISCSVLLLQADAASGGLLRDEEVATGLRLMPSSSRVRLQGIGHELHGPPEQARQVFEAIAPFLASL
jgi:pimeloyl-ACP methyl ester carboxylesterase